MPQLEVATYASQIFWLIVAFSTLYWLLSRRALPRVAEILEARQDRRRPRPGAAAAQRGGRRAAALRRAARAGA